MTLEQHRETDLTTQLAREVARQLGYLLQNERAGNGIDQTELAVQVGASRATISRLERGKNVASETLFRVMAELDVLKELAFIISSRLDDTELLQRKNSGPRNRERQQKWQEFYAYWNPD
ncbi:helix-turn-helix domain-containing protein [Pseudidiomarina sp. E22-M8]|uniref:helix-turn-helix domain-containing protein n=1 Tax=Pseudidiomarina sp. E22-M8 TaxID=3424768 RepID=UPI00403CF6BE